jgi:hypothetical protein
MLAAAREPAGPLLDAQLPYHPPGTCQSCCHLPLLILELSAACPAPPALPGQLLTRRPDLAGETPDLGPERGQRPVLAGLPRIHEGLDLGYLLLMLSHRHHGDRGRRPGARSLTAPAQSHISTPGQKLPVQYRSGP